VSEFTRRYIYQGTHKIDVTNSFQYCTHCGMFIYEVWHGIWGSNTEIRISSTNRIPSKHYGSLVETITCKEFMILDVLT